MLSLPGHMSSSADISAVRVARSLVFGLMFCGSLFVLLSFLPSDLQIPINPFVSSNSSYTTEHIILNTYVNQ
jgi:membrane protein DedA with SNARE-associated domain